MRVFRSHDGGRNWEVVWTFAGIRHIHTVLANEDEIWVTTGDLDEECGIWVTRDEFRTMDRIVGGEQRYRAVQLLFDQARCFTVRMHPILLTIFAASTVEVEL